MRSSRGLRCAPSAEERSSRAQRRRRGGDEAGTPYSVPAWSGHAGAATAPHGMQRSREQLGAHHESLDRLLVSTKVQCAPRQTRLALLADPFADEEFAACGLALHPCRNVDSVAECREIGHRAAYITYVRDPGV